MAPAVEYCRLLRSFAATTSGGSYSIANIGLAAECGVFRGGETAPHWTAGQIPAGTAECPATPRRSCAPRFRRGVFRGGKTAPHWTAGQIPAGTAEYPATPEPQRAAEYVEAHLADTLLNVDALARVAGISKYHFIRTFEKTYGISPWKYLLARRLYHAAQLLAQDKTMPLKAIIQQCGFTSETYFCRAFRKTYQRSPGNHRRLMSSEIPTTL